MKTKAALAADPDGEWLDSVAAAARGRSTLLHAAAARAII